jgi:NADH-ubiquinone oxidoreductase chain 6
MVTFFFNLLALGTIISGIFSITSKNPIISVIFLISTFVQAAGYLILIGINFIGISYIVIYVGAIAVLFLFVIMMINIKLTDILESGSQYTKNLPLAIVIGSLFLYIIYTIIPFNFYNDPILYTILNKLIIFNTDYNTINVTNNLFPWANIDFITNLPELVQSNGLDLLANSDTYFTPFLQIEVLGHNLYTNGSILLIILSFILLLSMLAIIIISSNK